MAQRFKFGAVTTSAAWLQFPAMELHHSSVSCHAVVAGHKEELEALTNRIYNYALVLCGRKKMQLKYQGIVLNWM